MIKYTPPSQLSLVLFSHPFESELSPENRWVKLAEIVPWDELAEVYARNLSSDSGRNSIDIRMVMGALIVKHKLQLDDRGTVEMISENLYLQYFCGLKSFQKERPFHPTVFVDIRKRMGGKKFDRWNELIIEKADSIRPKKKRLIDSKKQKNENENENQDQDHHPTSSNNKGTLKIDATVADQKIDFPTDAKLLNTAREESERLIDVIYPQTSLSTKPRTYRKEAGKEEEMIATYQNPVAFIELYNEAVSEMPEEYQYSDLFIEHIKKLQDQHLKSLEQPVVLKE